MFKYAVMALGLVFSSLSQAEMIVGDLDQAGDGKVTIDTSTGIEWLDLTDTKGMSVNAVLAEMGKGGLYEGWRLPTEEEVRTMFNGYLSPYRNVAETTENYYVKFYAKTNSGIWNAYRAMESDLGRTYSDESGIGSDRRVRGFYLDEDGDVNLLQWRAYDRSSDYMQMWFSHENSYTLDSSGSTTSIFLVNDGGMSLTSIEYPELFIENPDAPINNAPVIAMSGLALLGLGLRRKKQS